LPRDWPNRLIERIAENDIVALSCAGTIFLYLRHQVDRAECVTARLLPEVDLRHI